MGTTIIENRQFRPKFCKLINHKGETPLERSKIRQHLYAVLKLANL